MNDQIKNSKVVLIGSGGENFGVVERADALSKASDLDLDVIVVNDKPDVPICKLIDYGKYKYEQKIKKKNNKKNLKRKKIFLSLNIGEHDQKIKLKKVIGFLEKKMEVVVEIKLKGRYRGRSDLAKNKIIEALQSESIDIDDNNWRISGNNVAILINP
jgi:translation initiation factor IF-3